MTGVALEYFGTLVIVQGKGGVRGGTMAPSDMSPRPAVMAVSACEAAGEVVGSTDSAAESWCDGDWAYAGIIVSAQTGLSARVSVACIHTDYKDRTCEAGQRQRESRGW